VPGPKKYPDELRERAIRFALDLMSGPQGLSANAASKRVGEQLGTNADSWRNWIKQHRIDEGEQVGVSSDDRTRLVQLERENRDLRRTNVILKSAPGSIRRYPVHRKARRSWRCRVNRVQRRQLPQRRQGVPQRLVQDRGHPPARAVEGPERRRAGHVGAGRLAAITAACTPGVATAHQQSTRTSTTVRSPASPRTYRQPQTSTKTGAVHRRPGLIPLSRSQPPRQSPARHGRRPTSPAQPVRNGHPGRRRPTGGSLTGTGVGVAVVGRAGRLRMVRPADRSSAERC
jgi:transposase